MSVAGAAVAGAPRKPSPRRSVRLMDAAPVVRDWLERQITIGRVDIDDIELIERLIADLEAG